MVCEVPYPQPRMGTMAQALCSQLFVHYNHTMMSHLNKNVSMGWNNEGTKPFRHFCRSGKAAVLP